MMIYTRRTTLSFSPSDGEKVAEGRMRGVYLHLDHMI